jgi:hypothetical protein
MTEKICANCEHIHRDRETETFWCKNADIRDRWTQTCPEFMFNTTYPQEKGGNKMNCSIDSFLVSVMQCARLGLEPILGRAYLIHPYKGACTFQAGYQMKLSDVIKIWDILHVKNTGEISFCDLETAISETAGVENDISPVLPNNERKGEKMEIIPLTPEVAKHIKYPPHTVRKGERYLEIYRDSEGNICNNGIFKRCLRCVDTTEVIDFKPDLPIGEF